jgi:glycine hydroxymethyltransferase
MTMLARRAWVPEACEALIQSVAAETADRDADRIEAELTRLTDWNRDIHERDCVNLNPATNVMNPKAEALLAAGLGSRPSLGYPGDKYEMGLEAIERIEVIAAELAAEVFGARFAEIRVAAGAMANLYVFMATAKPGDAIIVPPAEIGGHVTHHGPGAAGLYGLKIHPAPVDADGYTVDLERLREQARQVRPKLITIAGSLNLFPHPVRELRAIADEVGARLLYDAAHMSGMIAGRAWQQPLAEGAHAMTMSTYKSLGGPPAGLILTNEPDLAERLDRIAFPGLTANFDAAKSAALAMTLLDWKVHGPDYAATMARLHHLAPVRSRGRDLRRRAGDGETVAPGQYPDLWHRAAGRQGRGRRERPAPGDAGDRALGHDAERHAPPRPPDRPCLGWRGTGGGRAGGQGLPLGLPRPPLRPIRRLPADLTTGPGRRTAACGSACRSRRTARWQPPARQGARPARLPRSAPRPRTRCGPPPPACR